MKNNIPHSFCCNVRTCSMIAAGAACICLFSACISTRSPAPADASGKAVAAAHSGKSTPSTQGIVFSAVTDPLDSWNMVLLAQSQTALVKPFTGDRELGASELILRLHAAGMLSSDITPAPARQLSRAECIQFLWNLYAYDKDFSAFDRSASTLFAQQGIDASPVKDIRVGTDEFDAVYGFSSRRILSLNNGYFFPDEKMSVAEFKQWLASASNR